MLRFNGLSLELVVYVDGRELVGSGSVLLLSVCFDAGAVSAVWRIRQLTERSHLGSFLLLSRSLKSRRFHERLIELKN